MSLVAILARPTQCESLPRRQLCILRSFRSNRVCKRENGRNCTSYRHKSYHYGLIALLSSTFRTITASDEIKVCTRLAAWQILLNTLKILWRFSTAHLEKISGMVCQCASHINCSILALSSSSISYLSLYLYL